MTAEKEYKLDLFKVVLPAIDKRDKKYYSKLTDEEKKAYSAFILMRALSSLPDQNSNASFQLLMVNDIVNIGFWQLNKHPELQHLLMCITGLGSKQFHPWINVKGKSSTTPIVDDFILELYPDINLIELGILRKQFDKNSIKELAQDAGKSDAEIKRLVEDAKKIN